ncbi:MAG: MFS transporter [Hyphomonadaceae bacterium]
MDDLPGSQSRAGGAPAPPSSPAQVPADTAAVTQDDYDRFVRENLPRNFFGHFIHGMLGMTGFRLVNAPTFVPVYLHSISGSDFWVGLGLSLQQLGAIASPIIGASQMEHRKRILPISVALGWLMRLQILGLAVSGWFLTGSPALMCALLFLFLLGVFQGPQRVAFQFLLGKVIPVGIRGRLNAWRSFAGGLVAAGLSWVAGAYIVGPNLLGNGYATTFFLAFLLTSLGLTALRMLMREPEPPSVRQRVALRDRLKDVPNLIRADKGFAWFMVARSFAMGMRIGQPFFFLFAAQQLGLFEKANPVAFGQVVGVLSFAYMGGDTVSNLIWGYLSDRGGFKSTFVVSMALQVASVVMLLNFHTLPLLMVAFCGLGAAQSAYIMSSMNIVMEFGHRHDMAMRMALSNTAEGLMGAAAPLIGAGLSLAGGYPAAFYATIVSVLIALVILLFKVDEPRRRASQG